MIPEDLILSCGRLKVVAEPSILMTPYPTPHVEKNADVRKGRKVWLHLFRLAHTHLGSPFLIPLLCDVVERFSNYSEDCLKPYKVCADAVLDTKFNQLRGFF
jgi:hypothetical protein